MPHYATRHLVANTELDMGRAWYKKGDAFMATAIDADYLIAKGKASVAPEPAIASPAPLPVVESTRVPMFGDDVKVEAVTTRQLTVEESVVHELKAETPVHTPARRGRPPAVKTAGDKQP